MELYDNDKQDEVSALGKDPRIKEIQFDLRKV